jgi:hypothetical protein
MTTPVRPLTEIHLSSNQSIHTMFANTTSSNNMGDFLKLFDNTTLQITPSSSPTVPKLKLEPDKPRSSHTTVTVRPDTKGVDKTKRNVRSAQSACRRHAEPLPLIRSQSMVEHMLYIYW